MRASAILSLIPALLLLCRTSYAEKSKFYYMDSLCKDHFLQRQYRKLDGGVVWSRNERNLDCTVTFQTHSILQRFMLHFDLLQLDCNDHLYVYDGGFDTSPAKVDLSCRNTKQQVGALFTRSNFVTLKYVTDNWGTDANGFKLVITAVKDPKHGCKEFRCKQREFCVSEDLMCDGVDHCADGSDEDTAKLCPETNGSTVWSAWMVVAGASLVLVAIAAFVVVCCVCKRRTVDATASHIQLQQLSSNGGKALEAGEMGNWEPPAGQRGRRAGPPFRPRPTRTSGSSDLAGGRKHLSTPAAEDPYIYCNSYLSVLISFLDDFFYLTF